MSGKSCTFVMSKGNNNINKPNNNNYGKLQ